jgi:hypothetical protein
MIKSYGMLILSCIVYKCAANQMLLGIFMDGLWIHILSAKQIAPLEVDSTYHDTPSL